MEGYINKVFLKYVHIKPTHPQLTQYKNQEIKYGVKHQLSPAEDTRPALDSAGVKIIQTIIGALLYYARSVKNKILVALSAIGS